MEKPGGGVEKGAKMSLEQQTVDGVRRNYFAKIETTSSKLAKYFVREMFKRLSSQEENSKGSNELKPEENDVSDIIAKAEEDGATIYKTHDTKEISFIKNYAFRNKIPVIHKYNKETGEYIFIAKSEEMNNILEDMQKKAKEIGEKEVNKILNETEKELSMNVKKIGNENKDITISNLSEIEVNSIIRKFLKDKSEAIDYSVIKESTSNGHETYQLTIPEAFVINEKENETDIVEAVLQTRLELDGQFGDDRYDEEMDYLRILKGMESAFSNLLEEKKQVVIASKDGRNIISINKNGFDIGRIERDKEGNVVIHREMPEPSPTILIKELEHLRANEITEKKFSFHIRDKKNEKTRKGKKISGTKYINIVINNPTGEKGDAIIKVNGLERSAKEAIEFIYGHSDGAGIKKAYENFRMQYDIPAFFSFHDENSGRILRKAMKEIDRPQILYNEQDLYKHLITLESYGNKEKSESKSHKDQTAIFSKLFSNIVKEELMQNDEFKNLPAHEKTKKILGKCGLILSNLQNHGALSEGDLTGDRANRFMQLYKNYDVSIAQCSAVPNQLNKICRNIKYADEIEKERLLTRGTIKDILEKEILNTKPGCKKEFTLKSILNASKDYDKSLERNPIGRITIGRTAKGNPEIFLNNQRTTVNTIVVTITDCFEKGNMKRAKKRDKQFDYER